MSSFSGSSPFSSSLVADSYRLAKVDKLVASLEEQMDQTRRYRIKAATDGLTGLANREHVMSMLESSLEAAKSQGWPLCVVVLDVDKFKHVNDTFGHPAGDVILKVLSKHLGSALRDVDLVGRYGGDVFLIVLQNAPLHVALKVAERLRQQVQKRPVNAPGQALTVSISQGVAMARKLDTVETLIARADAALLEAKRRGRNCVVSAEAEEEAP